MIRRPDMRRYRWVAVLAIVVAVAMTALGLVFVGWYLFEAIRVYDQADRSMLFWLLPFAMLGFAVMLLGAALGWAGWRARRGDANAQQLSAIGLKIIAIVVVVLVAGMLLRAA